MTVALGRVTLMKSRRSPRPSHWDLMLWSTLGALAAAGAATVHFVDPRVPGNYPPCLFLYFTGCYCPGCGTLRALHRLLHGDLRGAFGYNPLAMAVLPFLAAGALECVARRRGRPLLAASAIPPRVAWGILVAIIAFWALRNVPLYPFTMLAP